MGTWVGTHATVTVPQIGRQWAAVGWFFHGVGMCRRFLQAPSTCQALHRRLAQTYLNVGDAATPLAPAGFLAPIGMCPNTTDPLELSSGRGLSA